MELVPFLRSLVAIDSTSARSNLPILDRLEAEARAIGFETRRATWVDEAGVDKGNLVCRRGPDGPGGLALVGHTDCVPFDPEWNEALAGAVRPGDAARVEPRRARLGLEQVEDGQVGARRGRVDRDEGAEERDRVHAPEA